MYGRTAWFHSSGGWTRHSRFAGDIAKGLEHSEVFVFVGQGWLVSPETSVLVAGFSPPCQTAREAAARTVASEYGVRWVIVEKRRPLSFSGTEWLH